MEKDTKLISKINGWTEITFFGVKIIILFTHSALITSFMYAQKTNQDSQKETLKTMWLIQQNSFPYDSKMSVKIGLSVNKGLQPLLVS